MNPLPLSEIARFAGGSISCGDETVTIEKVTTDSRTLKPGELFVALRGENFDGHNFVESAAQSGAAGAIVESAWNGKIPKDFALKCSGDYRKQWQDEHEGLHRRSTRPSFSSDEDRRKFQ